MNKYSQAIINYLNNRDDDLINNKHNFILIDMNNDVDTYKLINKIKNEYDVSNSILNLTFHSLTDPKDIVELEDNQNIYDALYAQQMLIKEVRKINKK